MDWRQYEKVVLRELESVYLGASVSFNLELFGQFSRTGRQCDVVVDERFGGKNIRTLIDAKCRTRRVDVKCVEEFAGMLRDVGCDRGIIITNNGFTSSAENLAFYGDDDIDLDILSLSNLREFQGIGAIPYSGKLGLLVRSPLGWVTDAKSREGLIASFYQRGLSFEQALERREFMYMNFWHLKDQESLDDLLQVQEANLGLFYPDGFRIAYSSIVGGRNGVMKLREVELFGKGHLEISGFLVIDQCVVFGVMHTPRLRKTKNLRKLIHLLTLALPAEVSVKEC